MTTTCGIEISARRAIFVFLRRDGERILDVTGKNTQIKIKDDDSPVDLRRFCQAAHALLDQLQPDDIGIVQRKKRGHFASGGTTFKLESLIQLYPQADIRMVAPAALRLFVKEHRPELSPRYSYQKNAYLLAHYLLQDGHMDG